VPKLRHVLSFAIVAAALCAVGAHGQNLDEGKTAPQLFALDCQACHRTPQGLAKNYNGWSLTSFLRQHYTSSAGSANILAAYLTSVGNARATDQKKGRADKSDERHAKQTPASPRDQAKAGKAEPTAEQQGQPPSRRQREQGARSADPDGDPPARPSRRTRRGGEAAEPVPGSSADPTSSIPTATAAAPDSARDSSPAGASEEAAPAQAAAAPQPGFGDPLP
jgi:hypothetical protein